jgi:hypothetical protein
LIWFVGEVSQHIFDEAARYRRPSARLTHIATMDLDNDAPHAFRCPNLDCSAQYVALPKEYPPDKAPRCIDCDTPFLAKHKGRFLHYQSLRFD